MTEPLIVGLGSHFGHDRVGWIVVDRLKELGVPSCQLKQARHTAEILDMIDVNRDLVVCDACEGTNPGAIHCWEWPSKRLESLRRRGTHDIGLDEMLELASQFGLCPRHVEIWAIEGQDWQPTSKLETSLLDAAFSAAEAIRRKYADARTIAGGSTH